MPDACVCTAWWWPPPSWHGDARGQSTPPAAAALSSIEVGQVAAHEQLDSLVVCLEQHGRHIISLDVAACDSDNSVSKGIQIQIQFSDGYMYMSPFHFFLTNSPMDGRVKSYSSVSAVLPYPSRVCFTARPHCVTLNPRPSRATSSWCAVGDPHAA